MRAECNSESSGCLGERQETIKQAGRQANRNRQTGSEEDGMLELGNRFRGALPALEEEAWDAGGRGERKPG